MLAAALAMALTAAAPVGELRFTAPPDFHADAELAQGETAALAIPAEGDPERHLAVLLRDDAAEPATLALSTVEAPLQLDAASKATLAAVVAGHFKRTLELPFALERTVFLRTPQPRVEVWGTVSIESRTREVGVAFFAGAHRHVVAVASLPAARAAALQPQIESAWASLQPTEAPEPIARRRTIISLVVWGLAASAFMLVRVLRRRRSRSAPP